MLEKIKHWLPWLFYEEKQCGVCHQMKLPVYKRIFLMPPNYTETMTSSSEMCNECYDVLKKMSNQP